MTIQFSIAVQNARNDAIETVIGASAVLKIRTGAQPATCAHMDTGTVLCAINLPSDWMADSVDGIKSKLGVWKQTSASASGEAGHFRVYDSTATVCGMQGSITVTGGGGDIELSDINIVAFGVVTIVTCNFGDGNT